MLRSVTSAVDDAIDGSTPIASCPSTRSSTTSACARCTARSAGSRSSPSSPTSSTSMLRLGMPRRRRGGRPVSRTASNSCRRAGIPASRCHDLGLAVDRRFTDLPSDPAGIAALRRAARPAHRQLRRARLRWCRRIGRARRATRRRSRPLGLDLDLVVICGRNERAHSALAGLRTAAGREVRVLGYVDRHAAMDARQRCRGVQGRTWNDRGSALLRPAASPRLVSPRPGARQRRVGGRHRRRPLRPARRAADRCRDGARRSRIRDARCDARRGEGCSAARRNASHRGVDRLDGGRAGRASTRRRGCPAEPPVPRARCAIVRLRVHCFRNYAEATVRFGPGLNIIHGQNAQGKTNLLEAIATLALTRSPRTTSSGDLLLWSHEEAALAEADVERPPADVTLAVRFQRDPSTGRVSRSQRSSTASHVAARAVLGVCPVVLFWPEDLALVRGGPEGRRRFLDVILAQTDPQAVAHMSRYRRVLEQRNALLHQFRPAAALAIRSTASRASSPDHGAWLAQALVRASSIALAPLAAHCAPRPERSARAHRAALRAGAYRRDSR